MSLFIGTGAQIRFRKAGKHSSIIPIARRNIKV
jgi:hypothetical protein